MFKIIDQKNRAIFECDINHIFAEKAHPLPTNNSVYDHDHSIYITYQDPHTGLRMGARLNPMTTKNLTSDTLGSYVRGFEAQGIWECSLMVFHLKDSHTIQDGQEAVHRLHFKCYEGFREAVITACVRFQIGTLLFLAPPEEIEKLQLFGEMRFKPKLALEDNLCIALFQNPHRH
ncbi:MAG: hypothetical protein C0514_08175 [Candidatus Puniceispirillum sp.]|nr:hypothetical protein [Candidatus Puniceispirillum sp.]